MEERKKSKLRRIVKVVCIIATIFISALLVLSAYGGLVDPTKTSIFAFITLTFPFLLGLTLFIAFLWFIVLRWRVALIPLVAVAVSRCAR